MAMVTNTLKFNKDNCWPPFLLEIAFIQIKLQSFYPALPYMLFSTSLRTIQTIEELSYSKQFYPSNFLHWTLYHSENTIYRVP